jgi:O-antigen/teichoic acid export membrane protein
MLLKALNANAAGQALMRIPLKRASRFTGSAWRRSQYLRDSSHVFAWMLARAAALAALLVGTSRLLGAAGYGQFIATVAVAALMAPLAGAGLGGLLLREGIRRPAELDDLTRSALRTWAATIAIVAPAGAALAWALLPSGLPWLAVLFVIIAEVIASSLTELLARVQQARRSLGAYGRITAGLSVLRATLLLPYALLAKPDLAAWLCLYGGVGLAYAGLIARIYWPRSPQRCEAALNALGGLPFSFNALSIRLQAEFNKPVLAKASFERAGNFSAAQRFVETATLPLQALQEALWPHLYADRNPLSKLRTFGAVLLGVALLGGVMLTQLSGWIPLILGPEFLPAVEALKMLAWLPAVQLLRGLINFVVIHSDKVPVIGWAAAVGGVVSVISVSLCVPRWGMAGAAFSSYATEVAMMATLLAGLWFKPGSQVRT